MQPDDNAGFRIWGVDNNIYGPVELPTLVSWVKDERVLPETWVFSDKDEAWQKAVRVPELRMFFQPRLSPAPVAAPGAAAAGTEIRPGVLRRVKIFADFTDDRLQRFIQFMEVKPVRQFEQIVKQGEDGDAMFLVLEGELRVRMMIQGKETVLVTLAPGEFFGEISLFDRGPRSADVVSNKDSVLLKITTEAFEKMRTDAPELAAPFLFGICKTLTARIRADNKRYRDSVTFARAAAQ